MLSMKWKTLWSPISLLVSLLLLSPVALFAGGDERGDDLGLFGEIPSVFSASKYAQKATEAPSSVTFITAEEIRASNYRTLSDVLRSVRGFYISNDHNYEYIGMRGFSRPGDYNSRVLLLIDGVRINDDIYDSALIGDEFPVDLDLVDRIEIVRGPTSSLYGTNAFFGTINVFTKRGRDFRGPELAAFAGEDSLFGGRASYGQKYSSGLEVLLSGSSLASDGADWYFEEFDDPYYNNGKAEGIDERRVYNLFFKASIADFTLMGTFNHREDGYPTAPWETEFNDPDSDTMDEYLTASLIYDRTTASQWDISGKLTYNRYVYEGDYPYDWADYESDPDADPYILNGFDKTRSDALGASLQVGKQLTEQHLLIAGGEYRDSYNLEQKYFNYRQTTPLPAEFDYIVRQPLDSDEDSSVWAFYLQDEYRINDQWILNAGVRFDDYSSFGGTTNPRLALIYSPRDATSFKWLYGTAFRAPSSYELFYGDNETMLANPDLDPEEITTYEFVWEEQLAANLQLVFNPFYYEIEELIGQSTIDVDGWPLLVFQNLEEVKSYGVEFSLEGTLLDKLKTRFSYTYAKTENKETGEELSNAPRQLGKLNISLPLWHDKFNLTLEEFYTSSRLTADLSERVDAFWVTNLTLATQAVLDDLSLSFSIYNLFDETYEDPGSGEHLQQGLEQHGRQLFLKAVYSF